MKANLVLSLFVVSTAAFNFRKVYLKVRSILHDDTLSCDKANSGKECIGSDCPLCWIKNGSKYDCYNYNEVGQCLWSGMIDQKRKKYPAPTCLHGHQVGKVCDTDKGQCPPCWSKSDGVYGCYAYYKGKCPWSGMMDINKN